MVTTIDLAGLVADAHLNLDAIFDDADWTTTESGVAGYVSCCFGDDGGQPGDVVVDLQSADAYGITAWRWYESESCDHGETYLTEAEARQDAGQTSAGSTPPRPSAS
jgi:hypothetical protein